MARALPHVQRLNERLARDATGGELFIAWARLVIVVIALARSIWEWLHLDPRAMGSLLSAILPIFGLAVAFSVVVIARYRTRTAPVWLFNASVSVDVLLTGAALANNGLQPSLSYPGLPFIPDSASLAIVVIGSALRLSVRTSLLGGALASIAFASLMYAEHRYGLWAVSVEALTNLSALAGIIAGATFLATVAAAQTRALAQRAAERAIDAERAERGLGLLSRSQEDLRGLLSSAALDAAALRDATAHAPAAARQVVDQLCRDIADVNDFLVRIDDAAPIASSRGGRPVAASLLRAAQRVRDQLAPRFPSARIEVRIADDVILQVLGGSPALERALHNLVVNACEGDGRTSGKQVTLRARIAAPADDVAILVEDDGPGFPDSVLDPARSRRLTTKRGGTGLGLGLVRQFAEAHAGQLVLENGESGGAAARLELPRQASAARAPARGPDAVTTDALLRWAGSRAERVIAGLRLALGCLALAHPSHAVGALGLLAALFSVFTLARGARHDFGPRFLVLSAVLDVLLCVSAIVATVAGFGPHHTGLHELAVLSLLLIPVMGAGLRISVPASVASGCLALLGLWALLAVDQALNAPQSRLLPHSVSAHVMLLLRAGGLGVLLVVRARRIIGDGGRAALELERAATSLRLVMRDHHDVRTLLSSASLNAGMAVRELEAVAPALRDLAVAGRLARRVADQLERVNDHVSGVRERSYSQLAALRL